MLVLVCPVLMLVMMVLVLTLVGWEAIAEDGNQLGRHKEIVGNTRTMVSNRYFGCHGFALSCGYVPVMVVSSVVYHLIKVGKELVQYSGILMCVVM